MGDLQSGPCRHAGGGVFQRLGAIVARARSSCTRLTLGTSFSQMTFIDHPLGQRQSPCDRLRDPELEPWWCRGHIQRPPVGSLVQLQRPRNGQSSTRTSPPCRKAPPSTSRSRRSMHRPSFTTATAGNYPAATRPIIDNPVTNGDPDAILHVTQNWNPSGIGGVYNDHPIGGLVSDGAGNGRSSTRTMPPCR